MTVAFLREMGGPTPALPEGKGVSPPSFGGGWGEARLGGGPTPTLPEGKGVSPLLRRGLGGGPVGGRPDWEAAPSVGVVAQEFEAHELHFLPGDLLFLEFLIGHVNGVGLGLFEIVHDGLAHILVHHFVEVVVEAKFGA